MADTLPEYWLRGPIEGLNPFLQPVAHALLQAREEVLSRMEHFPAALLWERPYGMASPGFHLQHLTGVLDRLFTYARGEELRPEQLAYLHTEGQSPSSSLTTGTLVQQFSAQVDKALDDLRLYETYRLADLRLVGRQKLPSTVIGLLVHAAEHTTRHTGQLLVLSTVVYESRPL